ncbi:MAG: carbon-nitrogen hydrolase family protein [Gammaproteobacteria bacterium]
MSKIACIQMASGPNVQANLLEAERLIEVAKNAGATLAMLPENFAIMGATEQDKLGIKEQLGSGPIQDFLAQQARKHSLWIVGGTIPLTSENPEKISAACLLFDTHGKAVAHYNKIHLFDVTLIDSEESYIESQTIEPGDNVVVVDTPIGRVGLSVCYDLRFPELFRAMVRQGAEVILLPAAFTANTGRAHWNPLIRARAIENQCYFAASAQGGFHVNGRETYGHSMIVDPWGTVLVQQPNGPGAICAEIDLASLHHVREVFPVLEHISLGDTGK